MKMHTRIFRFVSTLITNIFMTAAFIFGIGGIALVFRLFKRTLLSSESARTSWNAPSGSPNAAHMY